MMVDDENLRKRMARYRLVRVLSNHRVATARTLEQKIADAGPGNLRVDPHVLTPVRNALIEEGRIHVIEEGGVRWFHLPETPQADVRKRLDEQLPVYRRFTKGSRGKRVGQCLEIAIYKALQHQTTLEYLGAFPNLAADDHGDDRLYSKEEPPQSLSGRRLAGDRRLDFLVRGPEAGWAGIEAKNIREWLYPDREEITDLLGKVVQLDCVPVLIGRRIPFVTFKVLSPCGVVFHQTYNQLLPEADRELADKARHKRLLGYHDIRVGNEPDQRLLKFVGTNLPRILPAARERFDEYKDLLEAFAQDMTYKSFAARVRRRSQGRCEGGDWDPPEGYT